MLSRCFLDCSVDVGVLITGLSQISSFFSASKNEMADREYDFIISSKQLCILYRV